MSFIFVLLPGLVMVPQTPSIDPARIEAETTADADVIRSLNKNGDVPTITRPVDIRFVGGAAALAKLEADAASLGLRVVQKTTDGQEIALDVQKDQTTDPLAIRKLTEMALRIETQYGVRYDGWGTVATKR